MHGSFMITQHLTVDKMTKPQQKIAATGCVTRPEDIVLTSDDYVGYMSNKTAALAGIVQVFLLILFSQCSHL